MRRVVMIGISMLECVWVCPCYCLCRPKMCVSQKTSQKAECGDWRRLLLELILLRTTLYTSQRKQTFVFVESATSKWRTYQLRIEEYALYRQKAFLLWRSSLSSVISKTCQLFYKWFQKFMWFSWATVCIVCTHSLLVWLLSAKYSRQLRQQRISGGADWGLKTYRLLLCVSSLYSD